MDIVMNKHKVILIFHRKHYLLVRNITKAGMLLLALVLALTFAHLVMVTILLGAMNGR